MRLRPSLTNRGWSLCGAAAALLVGARVLGVEELAMLAAAAFLVVVVAFVRARSHRLRISAERVLRPARAEAGETARADLTVMNLGTKTSPVLAATDAFDGGRRVARFLVPPLTPGETADAAYRLPTTRRGIYTIGPLTLSVHDAFGVVQTSLTLAGEDRFVVYPRVEEVLPLPGAASREARMGSMQASRVPVGLDFFGLREYEVGDDLRRVHWRSTARTGELMLRQDEMPWESRSTILLDTRPSTHHGESFERAVEIAASLATAMCRGRRQVRFITTGGVDIRSSGTDRYPQIMEYLAGASVETYVRWDQVMERLRRAGDGPLAAVVANAERSDLAALGALRPRLGLVLLVAIRPSAYGGVDLGGAPAAPGAVVVPVSADSPFRPAWNQAVVTCQRGAAARS
ncbi:MAG TPA: DUF58 domain-containing protein [Acidimicrobiia bacterium]